MFQKPHALEKACSPHEKNMQIPAVKKQISSLSTVLAC